MRRTYPVRFFGSFLLCALTLLATRPASAQMDREAQAHSLSSVKDFGLVVDIESSLKESEGLEITQWRERIISRLRERAGVELLARVDPLTDAHLYVHVNAMDMGDGLVPFSVEASFVQGARLPRDRDMLVTTWESGLVGLVSYDMLAAILESAEGLVAEFADDYVTANM